eukprot:13564720-Alexandrium_andersonii.AAC.1
MLPTASPAWHHYAALAAVAARFVLAGRADTRGGLQGTTVLQCAGDRGRALSTHSRARLRALEGEHAGHIDGLLAEVP